MDFNYTLDDFQTKAIESIKRDENILVCASTGCGKTVCGMYGIAHYLLKGKTIAYTTPIKTLSNQKYKEIKEYFETTFKDKHNIRVSVGLITGDQKINTEGNVLIMTAEILLHSLYNIKDKANSKPLYFSDDFITNLGCVVMDEVHFINDPDRGFVWEETIILLQPHVTMVMLSATISSPDSFCGWITRIKGKPTNHISVTKRVIPLEHYISVDQTLYKVLDKNNEFNDSNFIEAFSEFTQYSKKRYTNQHSINGAIKMMKNKDLLQCIIFMFSRANCEKYAKMVDVELITYEERTQIESTFDKYLIKHKGKYELLEQYNTIKNLIQNGVGFHHSGLLPILKEIIEILFSMGLIKVLFATETFAVGVNMPCRTVLMTNIEKPANEGRRLLLTSEYKQMTGRAGRRGIDSKGTVIILPMFEFPQMEELKRCMLGTLPSVSSRFDINYSFILKIVKSDSYNIDEFVLNSLFGVQYKAQIEQLEKHLADTQSAPTVSIHDADKDFIEYSKLLDLEMKYNSNSNSNSNSTMKMKLNKSQQKKKKTLQTSIMNNPQRKAQYEEFLKTSNNTEIIESLKSKLESLKSYVFSTCDKYIALFVRFGYIKGVKPYMEIRREDLTPKAMIASDINDCNPILLTEMIYRDVFVGLSGSEIIALLGVFVDDWNKDDRKQQHDIKCSHNVSHAISRVQEIASEFIEEEKRLGINNHLMNYWDLYYEFVDLFYYWADGGGIEILASSEIYEGNFVRNMLKIVNIVRNLMELMKISNNISLLPIFETLEGLIMKDIVEVNSLYV